MALVPFPPEPDVEYARELYACMEPIIAGCKDDEWRASRPDLQNTRNPLYARETGTNAFRNVAIETRMQLAMAFISLHQRGYAPGDANTNPREHDLQRFLLHCPLQEWIFHEVDLRAGAMPIPPDTRAWDIANAMAEGSNGFFKLATPRPPDVPMPREHVLIRAQQWYQHICNGIVEGWYSEPELA